MIGLTAVFTWPVLIAELVIFGTAAFTTFFAPAHTDQFPMPIAWWRGLAILNLIASPLVFMDMASGMAQLSWIQTVPFLPEITGETVAGRIWVWRMWLVVILAVTMWIPLRPKAAGAVAFILSAVLIALGSATSHAIDHGMLAIAIYFVHLAAAGLWLGALLSLLMSARTGAESLLVVAPRVSSASAWSVAAIGLSGVVTAIQSLGWNLRVLIESPYGLTLLWKLMTAAPVVLLGAYNRYWEMPKLSQESVRVTLVRSVIGECLLLIAVLAWSAILAATPPPH
ncbi:MAG TPA: CopD family protein [Candidatus Binataceae bacterium]|nr:CopD family protein [Candidatus Binataceae bacterium]